MVADPSKPLSPKTLLCESANTVTFQPGQPFNPFGLFNGIHIPEALVRCKDLSPGAKISYGRLARYAGQDGACHPRQQTLADELGVSGRQVRTYLGELIQHGFLRAIRRGLHKPNDYIFLWHPIFSGTDRRRNSGRGGEEHFTQDRKETSTQDWKKASSQERQETSVPLSRESGEENQLEESRPSSEPSSDLKRTESCLPASSENAAGRSPSLSEKRETLRTFLLKKFGKRFPHKAPGAKCLSDTLRALGNLGLGDLEAAIDARDADGPKIKSYGIIPLLARDAADWASTPQSDTETPKPKGGTVGEEEQRRRAYADMMEREKARKSPRQEWEEAQRRLHAK